MTNLSNNTDRFGDDRPVSKALYALTFCGEIPLEEIPREHAARLLECWAGRHLLSASERAAVLARFPETPQIGNAVPDGVEDVDEAVAAAFSLGLRLGASLAEREREIRRRLDGLSTRQPLTRGGWIDSGSGPGGGGER